MNSAKAHTRWMMAWATGVSLVWGHQAPAQEAAKKPEPPKAYLKGEDAGVAYTLQGEYAGDKLGLQVIALGGGKYEGVLYEGGLPGVGWDGKPPYKIAGGEFNDAVILRGKAKRFVEVAGGLAQVVDGGPAKVTLEKTERKSPTLGQKPPVGAVVLFDGSSADAWNGGRIDADKLLMEGVVSKKKFNDFTLHLEFRTPFMPASRGQGRGNSGLYLQNRYELQVLDSFGLEGLDNECGGIYQIKRPQVNACLPPLAWQTYDIDFTAPRFDSDGKKVKNAVMTVRHNGILIHDKLELPKHTPGGEGKESAEPGPFALQNHGDPVRFRNIWVLPKN